jgi:general secretion pathway protein M
MQRQLATMNAQANEARSLAGSAEEVTPTGGALRDALAKSLADNGMQPTQVQVIGAAVQIQLKNASFPNWTMWLDDARKQFKVQVSEAHIQALKPDGQVDLTASLQPASVK